MRSRIIHDKSEINTNPLYHMIHKFPDPCLGQGSGLRIACMMKLSSCACAGIRCRV